MSQSSTVVRLAVRELWITFRLLAVLVAFVGAGAIVALLPAAPAVGLGRLAAGLAAATAATSAVAAWSLADERTQGRAGWLIARSVSRGTYLLGWFIALTGTGLLGLAAGALLGWLAWAAMAPGLSARGFVTVILAVGATVGLAVAAGLLIGLVARRRLAAATTLAVAGIVAGGAWLAPGLGSVLPSAAFLLLPETIGAGGALPAALRTAGIGLVLTAGLLGAARLAMERAEL